MFSKLKQIKDLRDKAKTLQAMLSQESVTGTGSHGRVKVTMDGTQHITNIEIADELMNLNDKNKLQDAIKDAFNDAVKQCQRVVMEKMKGQPGFDLPGLS